MKMNNYLAFFVLLSFILLASADREDLNVENTNSTEKKGDEEDIFEDRINLTWGSASAHAKDSKGRYSGVKTKSWGVTSGIKNTATKKYISLGSKSGSSSKSYSSGRGAPKTWATTDSAAGRHASKGDAKAGYSGAHGTSKAETHSKTKLYNLGNGNVLYNNLNLNKKENNMTSASTDVQIENSQPVLNSAVLPFSSFTINH